MEDELALMTRLVGRCPYEVRNAYRAVAFILCHSLMAVLLLCAFKEGWEWVALPMDFHVRVTAASVVQAGG